VNIFDEFTQESENDILKNMQNDVGASVDTEQGSFVYDVLRPTARQVYNTRVDLNTVLMYAFVQKAGDKFLDLAGEGRGVPRVLGEKATGQILFTGVPNAIIPSGTLAQVSKDIIFFTTNDAVIPDNATNVNVEIIAENIGSIYNIPANSITQIPISIPGITSVTNPIPTKGGTDTEEDDDYRVRILQRLAHPPSSGNKDDYIRWAGEVTGVKGSKPIPLANGPGTVKVIVYGDNNQPLDSTIVQNVQNHIDPPLHGHGEGTAPIGASVEVVTPTIKKVDVIIKNLTSDDIDVAKTNIENNLKNLFLSIKPGEKLKLVDVIAAIADADKTDDFSIVTLNGVSGNITSNDEEKIVLGGVTYE